VKSLALLAVLVLLACGCGSSSNDLYSLEQTKACLTKDGVRLGGQLDFVATTATGGAVRAHVGSNFVTLVFGDTLDRADNINQAYHRVASKNVGIDDVLRQDRNAVMLWHAHPSDAEVARITACLK
jgi:hypothetical protein